MPWTREEKYFASLLIWRQNHSKLCKKIFTISLTFNNYLQKSQIDRWVHKFQATGSVNNLNKKAEKSQIWQEVDCKMSWRYEFCESFCRKVSEKFSPKTFTRTRFFTCTVGSISTLVIWSDMIVFLRLK